MTRLQWKLENFVSNVQRHLKETGETKRQFAKRVGVPEVWLRRISTAGICYGNKRSQKNLEKLAAAFGLKSPRELWAEPDSVDVDEVLELLKRDYPSQWALFVAYQWSRGKGNGEELAEAFFRKTMKDWAAKSKSGWELSRRFAEVTARHFEVVRRLEG